MRSCGMPQENEVPTQNIMETLLCLCGLNKIKYTCFDNSFVLHYQQNHKKVDLTKNATGKTSAVSL